MKVCLLRELRGLLNAVCHVRAKQGRAVETGEVSPPHHSERPAFASFFSFATPYYAGLR